MDRKMKKLFIEKYVNNLCITLRKNEYKIDIEKDLPEHILECYDWQSNLDIINLCYFLLCVDIRNTRYVNYGNEATNSIQESIIEYNAVFEEIYDRQTFYYRIMNRENFLGFNNINVVSVIYHNHCVEYVFKKYKNTLPTVLMFDSHRDLAGVNSKRAIQNYYDNCDIDTLKLSQHLYESIPFIGSVLYPMTIPYNTNNGIIYICPEWCNIEETNDTLYFDADPDNDNADFFSDEIYFVNDIPNTMKNIKSISYDSCYIKTLINNIDNYKCAITDEFILNIDLDYFCTNGTKEYDHIPLDTNTVDPVSHKRTLFDKNFAKDSSCKNDFENKISEEMEEIRNRIKDLICVCTKLKENGKIPGLIIFSDSTPIYFSHNHIIDNEESIMNSCSNAFTPKYLILWLKSTIYNNLKEIYDS